MPFGEDIFQNVGARTASLSYSTSQDDIRQKFTGYQKDSETQLDFAEARMYENRFGRFTAVDPLLASGQSSDPQSFNRYTYIANNPVVDTDPTGKCPIGRCPENYSGLVYTRTIDGKVFYNDEKVDDSWSLFTTGTDVITDPVDGITRRIYGSDTGRSGWITISKMTPYRDPWEGSLVPRRWRDPDPIMGEYVPVTKPRGGRFTIDDSGETDYVRYLDRKDEQRLYALIGMTQNVTLGGSRLTPSIGQTQLPSVFSLRNGYGLFGKNGLQIGSYRIDALYRNPSGGGTYFSLKQTNTGNLSILQPRPIGNVFRVDYGRIHGTENLRLHTTIRFTFKGIT